MEKEFYTDEFEQLLKEKADQFSMYPSKRVWHSIYNNLHPSRRWPSVAMSLLLITSLMFIGYLNTADNTGINLTGQLIGNSSNISNKESNIKNTITSLSGYTKEQDQPVSKAEPVNTYKAGYFTYIIVKNNRPNYFYSVPFTNQDDTKNIVGKQTEENKANEFIQTMDTYIKSNQILADIAIANRKNKTISTKPTDKNKNQDGITDEDDLTLNSTALKANPVTPGSAAGLLNPVNLNTALNNDEKPVAKSNLIATEKNALSLEEKAWIENYALQNNPVRNKWKGRMAYQIYATPAVNYRKLSTNSKGSTAAFSNSDINNSISQKPGFGIEAGVGITYAFAKKLQFKAGFQFNYTSYNIDADQTSHPVLTFILLNDPNTGYSYPAARTSTTANTYNSAALQPVKLHNRTYQISIPLGFAYKLSSKNNVDWIAGASVQPTYVFGGNANIISSDLKSYVSDPSSIRTWNMNLGFETYMNFKIGSYNFQLGPQVRYQLFSTYNKNIALIEKPYAVGLKLGLTKGF